MKLKTGDSTVESPSTGDIRRILQGLESSNDDFAILEASDLTYIQTTGRPSTGFVLEYQAGSTELHYRATETEIELADVVTAFSQYLAHDDQWRARFRWVREDISGVGEDADDESGCGITAMLLMTLVGLLYGIARFAA